MHSFNENKFVDFLDKKLKKKIFKCHLGSWEIEQDIFHYFLNVGRSKA